ncbi:MAG: hypothetical protein RL604_1132 [Pseudomonadota bacterium]|jgi:hypothetical protein
MSKNQEIYQNAHYLVLLPGELGIDTEVSFKINQQNQEIYKLMELHGKQTACFFTPYNPKGERIDEKENLMRMQELESVLQQKQLPYYYGQGGDSKGAWIEKSLLIVGIDKDVADQLAHQYEQNAVVWFELGNTPTLRWYIE